MEVLHAVSPGLDDRIRAHTVVARTPLVPELALHLITSASALWHGTEADALAAGLPEPYWAFAWPGGQALARHVLDHPELVRDKRVLSFGAGGGIDTLAALHAGAVDVLAADLDPVAVAAVRLNAALNGLPAPRTTIKDLVGRAVDVDLVLAGDVFYDPELATRGRAWLQSLADSGITVLVGDPSRGFLDLSGLEPLATYIATHDGELDPVHAKPTAVLRLPPRASVESERP